MSCPVLRQTYHTSPYVSIRQREGAASRDVLILVHMCSHTTIYVSSYYYICVPILVYVSSARRRRFARRPHATICALRLLCMCPHTTIYVLIPLYVSSYRRAVKRLEMPSARGLILLYMCPHTTIYVSSYYYIQASCQKTSDAER